MLAGHFTTALIAKQKFPKGTLLYFLIISQLQDFLWFAFHYLGLEPTNPSDALDATLSNMMVDMLYSHDLIPQLLWLIIVFVLGKLLFKNTKIGLVSMALVSIHFGLDFFSGHMHHLFGADTLETGQGVPFEILHPLIKETASKVTSLSPEKAQTGPAIRNDLKTIKNHLDLLNIQQQQIYTILTKSIQDGH